MSRYSIRPATLRDARSIANIHANVREIVYQEDADNLGASPTAAPSAMSLAYWREAIEYAEPQILVAQDDRGKIVGFVGFDRSRDAGTRPTVGEIWSLCVLPSHWNTGAGLALWDAARAGLQQEGCTQVTVWLPLRNERGLRFHERAGFRREVDSARTVSQGSLRIEKVRLRRATA